jgi:sec-independent protein translocase protein TatA
MDTTPQDLMIFGNPWQVMAVLAVIVLLFGRGKISDLMGDVAKGIKAFKKGMAEDDTPAPSAQAPKPVDHQPPKNEAGTPANTETGTRA